MKDRALNEHALRRDRALNGSEGNGSEGGSDPGSSGHGSDRGRVLGWGFVTAGLFAVAVGWFGVSGMDQLYRQIPYVISGGIGGALLVAIGVTVLIRSEHRRDRDALRDVLDAVHDLDDRVEARLGKLERRIASPAADGTSAPRRSGVARRKPGT